MIRFGGSYNLRESEDKGPSTCKLVPEQLESRASVNEAAQNSHFINCSIFFLDDSEHSFQVPKNAVGEELVKKVFDFLELADCDYFGLQYVCVTSSDIVRLKWLDTKKSIKRQMMCPPYHLFFRLKFYVSDPAKLNDEYTRYLIYLQLRKDLLDGRLPCNEELAAILGSFVVQAEFGDYCVDDNSYMKILRLLPAQATSLLRRIRELHALRLGQTPAEAQLNFLQKAKCLDFYGFDLYDAKDGCERPIKIGVNCNGISIFDQGAHVHSFPWAAIIKLSFKRKNFYLQIMTADDNAERVDTELSFNAVSAQNCKMLWKACIEHHTFFRLLAPPASVSRSLFHLGSRFRYSGRTMHQTMEESRKRNNTGTRRCSFQRNQVMLKDQKPPIPPSVAAQTSNGNVSKRNSASSILRSPTISSNSVVSATKKNEKSGSVTERQSEETVTKSSLAVQSKRSLSRRTSSLVRATLLRRKISQLNSSATSFLTNIFANSSANNLTLPLSLTNKKESCSEPDLSVESSSADANSPRLSTSKTSSSASSDVPPDPKTSSTSSDELKAELVDAAPEEMTLVDDERTIKDVDPAETNSEVEEANNSEETSDSEEEASALEEADSNEDSESVTPSRKSQRHSVIYNGALTNIDTLPSSLLQQDIANHPPQVALSRSRTSIEPNSALTTSLQSLTLDKPTNSKEGALTDDEGTCTTGRSWNVVPLTPQLGHARQQYRLTHSPSPYDSASLILNSSIATSNAAANRNRNTVYSVSDDESSRVWYPLSSGLRNSYDINEANVSSGQLKNGTTQQNRNRNNVVPLVPNTHRRSQQPLLNGSSHQKPGSSPINYSGDLFSNNNSIPSTNGHYFNTRPPVPQAHNSEHHHQNLSNGAARRTNAHVNIGASLMNGTEFPTSLNINSVYTHSPNNYTNRRSLNGGIYAENHSPATNTSTSSSNASARVVSAPNGISNNYNGSSGNARMNGSMSDLLAGNVSNPHYAKRVNSTLQQTQPQRPPSTSPSNSLNGEETSVLVKIHPDAQGRLGLNITGGADCAHPVIVSRIISGSPADRCFPRLNEGDQVLKINGQNINNWSYGNVVNFIRSLRSLGEIALTIKPNVYRCVELDESENHQYISPEATPHVAETVPRSDKLAQSLILLKEALETETIVKQFEQLHRKKPGLTANYSQSAANIRKNRYRDIRPYDETRVVLKRAPSGDYINASHINMEIPSSGIINSYIATQGPLATTSGDFWYMVWEQGSTNIIMLTTLYDKGRVKCHQYWPELNESVEFGQLIITNLSEQNERYCKNRELFIRNKMTREERKVTHIQYTAWPDHGVPENRKHFIDFVGEVRRARNGSLDPIIVHCSAGIGRTGVLILMETAACLIESNEPVYPLDIVQTMRAARSMMVQTTEQFIFTCQCILRAYHEGVIKPLAEYHKNALE